MLEGYAVETVDGLIFTVKGLIHPPDRLVAYLRYVPDPAGDRDRNGVRYRRLYRFGEQEQILETEYPVYLKIEPLLGIRTQSVPLKCISQVYDPCSVLAGLRKQGCIDPIELRVLSLVDLIQARAGQPVDGIGVTGSVLLGLHQSDSDIDLIVYGERQSRIVYNVMGELMDDPLTRLRRPDEQELAAIHAMHHPDTPLPLDDFVRLQIRKVNEARFDGHECFVRFVKRSEEVAGKYGDFRYEPLGTAVVRARVVEDGDAIFTPSRYVVEDTAVLDGTQVTDLRELISFRGRFSDQARVGEQVVARGNLEEVVPRKGRPYHCLVIGGSVGDFLLAEK